MAPRYDLPNAAPPPLRTVQELVNTLDREHGRELLPNAQALADWLSAHGLPGAEAVTSVAFERTLLLRDALRALLVGNAGGSIDRAALKTLNELAEEAGVRLRFGAAGRSELAVGSSGVSAAHGHIFVLVHEAAVAGTWQRLKACRQCRWAFYDHSRNRSAAWCSMQICGNRSKTKAYRARQQQRPPSATTRPRD
jgi:predicted RNA-binding Zn ribbon-like protein